MIRWKLIEHPSSGPGEGLSDAHRLYSFSGNLEFPRLAMILYKKPWGIKIVCQYCDGTGNIESFWKDCFVPNELKNDLIEMLQNI